MDPEVPNTTPENAAPDAAAPAAAPAVEAPKAPELPYDEMSRVFDELTEPVKKPDEAKPADAAKPAAEAAPPADAAKPAAEAAPPVDTAKPADAAPPADAAKPAAEATPPAPAKAAEVAPPPAPAKPAAEATPPAEPELYTKEEKEFLAAYEKDWADVARGEELRRRADINAAVQHVFGEINKVYGPMIERAMRASEAVEVQGNTEFIRGTHPDWSGKMHDELLKWADGLTGFHKSAAQHVIKDGSPEEVVELISAFKAAKQPAQPAATAVAAPAAPAAAAAKPTATVTDLSAAAKQAAKAIGAVDTKRTAVAPVSDDKNDFDGAWNEAIGAK